VLLLPETLPWQPGRKQNLLLWPIALNGWRPLKKSNRTLSLWLSDQSQNNMEMAIFATFFSNSKLPT
jgi:hypothetical protein